MVLSAQLASAMMAGSVIQTGDTYGRDLGGWRRVDGRSRHFLTCPQWLGFTSGTDSQRGHARPIWLAATGGLGDSRVSQAAFFAVSYRNPTCFRLWHRFRHLSLH